MSSTKEGIGSLITLTKTESLYGVAWEWHSSESQILKIHEKYKHLFFNKNIKIKMTFKTLKLFLEVVDKEKSELIKLKDGYAINL